MVNTTTNTKPVTALPPRKVDLPPNPSKDHTGIKLTWIQSDCGNCNTNITSQQLHCSWWNSSTDVIRSWCKWIPTTRLAYSNPATKLVKYQSMNIHFQLNIHICEKNKMIAIFPVIFIVPAAIARALEYIAAHPYHEPEQHYTGRVIPVTVKPSHTPFRFHKF